MSVKLPTEHHLEFLSLNLATKAHLSLHLSKYHIVAHVMAHMYMYVAFSCLKRSLYWNECSGSVGTVLDWGSKC